VKGFYFLFFGLCYRAAGELCKEVEVRGGRWRDCGGKVAGSGGIEDAEYGGMREGGG